MGLSTNRNKSFVHVRTDPEHVFTYAARQEFAQRGLSPDLAVYAGDLLGRFSGCYRWKRPLGELNPDLEVCTLKDMFQAAERARDPHQKYLILKHIGDFSLFMLGAMHEHVEIWKIAGVYRTYGRIGYGHSAKYAREHGSVSDLYHVYFALQDTFDRSTEAVRGTVERVSDMSDIELQQMGFVNMDQDEFSRRMLEGIANWRKEVA